VPSKRLFLLDVTVSRQTNWFPMIPAGMAHHRIMLSKAARYEED
jgi:acetolactate synthase I/II/III large subunit